MMANENHAMIALKIPRATALHLPSSLSPLPTPMEQLPLVPSLSYLPFSIDMTFSLS